MWVTFDDGDTDNSVVPRVGKTLWGSGQAGQEYEIYDMLTYA